MQRNEMMGFDELVTDFAITTLEIV